MTITLKLKFIIAASALLSVVSVILSVMAICRTLHEYLDFNGLMLLVGVLAIIVAILIGWQLSVLIDLKGYNEKFVAFTSKLESEINRAKGFSELGYAHTNIAWLTEARKEDWFIEYVRSSLSALIHFSAAGDYKNCWVIINNLICNIEGGDAEFFEKVKSLKEEWLQTLVDVKDKSKIDNFHEFISLISKF